MRQARLSFDGRIPEPPERSKAGVVNEQIEPRALADCALGVGNARFCGEISLDCLDFDRGLCRQRSQAVHAPGENKRVVASRGEFPGKDGPDTA
jgi:hypothetical protein